MKKTQRVSKNAYQSKKIRIGTMFLGGGEPVRVQTMTDTDTVDIARTWAQIRRCQKNGAEMLRLAVQTPKHARAFGVIKERLVSEKNHLPLVADVHYLPSAAWAVLPWADKIRINPGNFSPKPGKAALARELRPFLAAASKRRIVLRIGANIGSLPLHIIRKYGHGPEALVEAAMEYVDIIADLGFLDLVVAVKASQAKETIAANQELVKRFSVKKYDFPIHLGVTEAGGRESGSIKSAVALGALLSQGIGDTIRVSLVGRPEQELPVAYEILQALGLRLTKPDIVACPGCGRTAINTAKIVQELKKCLEPRKYLRIAVMGCAVNGLGEARLADAAFVGTAQGQGDIYKKGRISKQGVKEGAAARKLLLEIKD